MKYRIEKTGSVPAYLQLYRQIREDITGGWYREGDKLQSKRLIAEESGISVITVSHAYDLLVEEGYVESVERSGYFVSYRATDALPVGDAQSFPAENSFYNNGQLRLPENSDGRDQNALAASTVLSFPALARTMRRVIADYGERMLVKSENQGCQELRQAIAAYLGRSRGVLVRPEQIVIGSGAEYLYSLVVQMLGRETVYALENPSYEKIERVYRANGAQCQLLQLGKHGIRTGELERASDAIGVLHVTPFNSYPSGITASASKRHEYIRWAIRRGATIIEDDFDSEFSSLTRAEDTLFSLEPHRTVIYMNTFSQSIAPSIRIGYLVLPDERAGKLWKKIDFYSCTVPVFDQYVLAEFLRSGDFERHINRVRRKKRREREASEEAK